MPPTISKSRCSPKAWAKTADYKKYLARSANWKNLWDPDFTDGGFRDSFAPAIATEAGSRLSPRWMSCTWGGNTFYEGNSWTYSTFVPQDVASLIANVRRAQTLCRPSRRVLRTSLAATTWATSRAFLLPTSTTGPAAPTRPPSTCAQIIAASYHAGPRRPARQRRLRRHVFLVRLRADGHFSQCRPGCLPHRQPRLSRRPRFIWRRERLRHRSPQPVSRKHLRDLGHAERQAARPRLAAPSRDRRRGPSGADDGQARPATGPKHNPPPSTPAP